MSSIYLIKKCSKNFDIKKKKNFYVMIKFNLLQSFIRNHSQDTCLPIIKVNMLLNIFVFPSPLS